jgi:hypothetical protein
MSELIVSLTGCTLVEAEEALAASKGDTIEAVDTLLAKSSVAGDKYIPSKPIVDDGLTEEVRKNIVRAREFADLLNASPRNDLRAQPAQPQQPAQPDSQQQPLLDQPQRIQSETVASVQ